MFAVHHKTRQFLFCNLANKHFELKYKYKVQNIPEKPKVCFVCSGNICRSPTAEVVFNAMSRNQNLALRSDSAGLESYHIGQDMDKRARKALEKGGYSVGQHSAKKIDSNIFINREIVIALDRTHEKYLSKFIDQHSLDSHNSMFALPKVSLLMTYSQSFPNIDEVPDPYYGDSRDFQYALSLIEDACNGLLQNFTTTFLKNIN